MVKPPSNFDSAIAQLTRLIEPGVLGFYTDFEVTEVVATTDGQPNPINVFTIVVLESRPNQEAIQPTFLNDRRIKLSKLPGWNFGIVRYTQPVMELVSSLTTMDATCEWQASGKSLSLGRTVPLPAQFVPPNTADSIPLNNVLKNNFWNGSYVLEWTDRNKVALQPLFDNPELLQKLSTEIHEFAPLKLASLSDRLGNLLVQFPVTVLMSNFGSTRSDNGFFVEVAWHPSATPRNLRANCDVEFDGVVCGYISSTVQIPITRLPIPSSRGLHRGIIWDEQHQLLLADSAASSFINTIAFGIHMMDPEPRVFTVKEPDGSLLSHRIALSHSPVRSLVGDADNDANGGWTTKRMYRDELDKLARQRVFIQYKPVPGESRQVAHERALTDLRALINQYGGGGAWLWDPYLSARDVLNTLFHCKHAGADLRALTGAKAANDDESNSSMRQDYLDRQRQELDDSQSNFRGLHLEFRARNGQAGWPFHDRFLIFPKTDDRGALAWSLGTSVNNVGVEHHILQRVDDGQLIVDAFQDLWNQLDRPEHIVWRRQ
jgi:hypothetical protein